MGLGDAVKEAFECDRSARQAAWLGLGVRKETIFSIFKFSNRDAESNSMTGRSSASTMRLDGW